MSSDIQFDDGNTDIKGTYRSDLAKDFMSKHQKTPFLFRMFMVAGIANNEKHAQKIALVLGCILLLVAAYYFRQAVTPPHVVQIHFK